VVYGTCGRVTASASCLAPRLPSLRSRLRRRRATGYMDTQPVGQRAYVNARRDGS